MKNLLRYILLFILILFTSGCSVTYDLYINDNQTITEKISGKVTDKELNNDDRTDVNSYLYAFEMATPLVDGGGEFDKHITNKDKYKEFVFTYDYDKNYSSSNALNSCFDDVEYEENENEYIFNLSGNFNCLLSKKVVINLISSYDVIENNAKKRKGNKYTWTVKDSENVNIHAIVSKESLYSKNKSTSTSIFRIISLIVLIILCIITYLLYRKNNKD